MITTPLRCQQALQTALCDAPLSDSDWWLLLDAVKCRLAAAAEHPATLVAVVTECAGALEWLQRVRAPQHHHHR